MLLVCDLKEEFNPSNAEATFSQSTRMLGSLGYVTSDIYVCLCGIRKVNPCAAGG